MMAKNKGYILTPFWNVLLFDVLLIATPFLMLQNYLQSFVKELSSFSIDLNFIQIPVIFAIFIILILFLTIFFIKKISPRVIIVMLTVLLLMFVGQLTADYYINYKFYDLQNNWHYFAYGIFVFVMYRYLLTKNYKDENIVLIIFFKALIISAFDEGIQVFISNRIFDISDIAKDLWGVIMGLTIFLFIFKNYPINPIKWKFTYSYLKDYVKNPISIIFYLIIFTYIFLFISSVLTEAVYWNMVFLISIGLFSFIFFSIHLSKSKFGKYFVSSFYLILGLILLYSYFNYDSNKTIESIGTQSILYQGIPIIYFDVMVYPDKSFRLVDKKTSFKGGDFIRFFSQKADILLIASGINGQGGKGFTVGRYSEYPYFIFNKITQKPMQVVILKNDLAYKEYNRLVKLNKKVLLIVHNS